MFKITLPLTSFPQALTILTASRVLETGREVSASRHIIVKRENLKRAQIYKKIMASPIYTTEYVSKSEYDGPQMPKEGRGLLLSLPLLLLAFFW